MELDTVNSVPVFTLESDFIESEEEEESDELDFDVEHLPVSGFLEEFSHDNLSIRLNCVTRLRAVALSVGLKNFRESILPVLIDLLSDDESLLAVLAEELGEVVRYIGGREFIPSVTTRLESLARWHNIEVQERAVASLIKIIDYIDDSQVLKIYVGMILRLAKDESNVVSRVSACRILVALYSRSPLEVKSILKRLVLILGIDVNPLVRFEISSSLGVLASMMHRDSVFDILLPLHQYFSSSSLEYIKVAALKSTPEISDKLRSEIREKYILNVIKEALNDPSTGVRMAMTSRLCQFLKTFHSEESANFFTTSFNKLVYDCDPHLRSHAILLLEEFVSQLATKHRLMLIQDLMVPDLQMLQGDEDVGTREALASVICVFAKILPLDRFLSDVCPVLKRLIKDSSEKVRAELISRFYDLSKIIGVEKVHEQFLDLLLILANDVKWVVRLAAIDFHTKFAFSVGYERFEDYYHVTFLRWLSDSVSVVREKGVQGLSELMKKFGFQSQALIVPKVVSLIKSSNYLIRITCINLFTKISPFCSRDMNQQKVLPTLTKLIQDPVANVRLNVAKSFKVLAVQGGDRCPRQGVVHTSQLFVSMFLRPGLAELINDKDSDVRFLAKETFEYLESSATPIEEESA